MWEFIMFKQWQPWKTHCVNDDIIRNNQRNIWQNKRTIELRNFTHAKRIKKFNEIFGKHAWTLLGGGTL